MGEKCVITEDMRKYWREHKRLSRYKKKHPYLYHLKKIGIVLKEKLP